MKSPSQDLFFFNRRRFLIAAAGLPISVRAFALKGSHIQLAPVRPLCRATCCVDFFEVSMDGIWFEQAASAPARARRCECGFPAHYRVHPCPSDPARLRYGHQYEDWGLQAPKDAEFFEVWEGDRQSRDDYHAMMKRYFPGGKTDTRERRWASRWRRWS